MFSMFSHVLWAAKLVALKNIIILIKVKKNVLIVKLHFGSFTTPSLSMKHTWIDNNFHNGHRGYYRVVISYETTSVRFCLSYDPLKCNFIAFKMNTLGIADTDVVNDDTCTRQNVITRVVI